MDAQATYRDALVWDAHSGFELKPDTQLETLLAPWREAGVDFLSISVSYDPQPWFTAIENIAAIRRRLPVEAPYCRIVSSIREIDEARAEGKMVIR